MAGSLLEMTEGLTEPDNGWLSSGPRISFSTDFSQLGLDSPLREEGNASSSSRPSTEFEFCMTIESPVHGAPADEIFFNGKLLPLQLSGVQLVKEVLPDGKAETESSCQAPQEPLPSSSCAPAGCGSTSPRGPTCTGSWKELFGLGRGKLPGSGSKSARGVKHSKLVRLFLKRASEDFVKAHDVQVNSNPEEESTSGSVCLPPAEEEADQVQAAATDEKSSSSGTLEHGMSAEDPESDAAHSTDNSTSNPSFACSNLRNNSGRILLKNLERCTRNCARTSEQAKTCQKRESCKQLGSGGGEKAATAAASSSFSSSVRVAPVLSVPMCMDPVKETKSTMTGLRKLLLGKKTGAGSLQRVSWTCPGGAL